MSSTRRRKKNAQGNNKFGKLKIVCEIDRLKGERKKVLCLCDCGEFKEVRIDHLRSGRVQSCGCLRSEVLVNRNYVHGERYSDEYSIWFDMKRRCCDRSNSMYQFYGERGIVVCVDWMNSFQSFIEDVGRRPSKFHTLERIDNNGNYDPSNIKWVTRKEQARNRRSSLMLRLGNEIKCLAEWVEIYNCNYSIVYQRILRGWDLHRALTEGVK